MKTGWLMERYCILVARFIRHLAHKFSISGVSVLGKYQYLSDCAKAVSGLSVFRDCVTRPDSYELLTVRALLFLFHSFYVGLDSQGLSTLGSTIC